MICLDDVFRKSSWVLYISILWAEETYSLWSNFLLFLLLCLYMFILCFPFLYLYILLRSILSDFWWFLVTLAEQNPLLSIDIFSKCSKGLHPIALAHPYTPFKEAFCFHMFWEDSRCFASWLLIAYLYSWDMLWQHAWHISYIYIYIYIYGYMNALTNFVTDWHYWVPNIAPRLRSEIKSSCTWSALQKRLVPTEVFV